MTGKKRDNYSVGALRSVVVFCLIIASIVLCGVRIALIILNNNEAVIDTKISKSLVLGESRGLILDRDLNRLVCKNYNYVCAVKPSVSVINKLKVYMPIEFYVDSIEQLGKGNPVKFVSQNQIYHNDILCEKIYKRYNEKQIASHILGYVDSADNGICGVEKSYNELLKSYSGSLAVRFFTDGKGRIMDGSQAVKIDNNYNSKGGIVLTIDSAMQQSLETIIDRYVVKKGAAVLIDAKTGAIRACVSRPDFDPNNVENYLDSSDSPLFNRVLGAYPVGSVFKPIVAAAALEQGVKGSAKYECKGMIVKDGSSFRCTKVHGKVDMATALAYSCNCYFVNLINSIEPLGVLETAKNLGFGIENEIADGLLSYSGNLPDTDELDSFASLANLSFGQGALTATPLQIATLYCAIANGGEYQKPYLVEGFCDENGAFTKTHDSSFFYRAFSNESAHKLRGCLELVVSDGTGKNAASDYCTAAGKTASAQTGDYTNGKERLVTWFAGFFSYENSDLVLVVMNEDGRSGAEDCAPVFSEFVSSLKFVDN